MRDREQILAAVERLPRTVSRVGERRAPHKPLLLLLALATLRRDGRRLIPFRECEEKLRQLLDAYAPPVVGRHQPELPYWHLRTDGLWMVEGAADLPLQRGDFPKIGPLRQTSGGLPRDVATAFIASPSLQDEVIRRLLADHFPESLHEQLLEAVGIDLTEQPLSRRGIVAAEAVERSPLFRTEVLRAYGHRCAVTGFSVQLRGAHIGLEAAHVHWHSHGGPSTVDNGMALEATLHKLFDAGAWALTDERKVILSPDLTGSDAATEELLQLKDKQLRPPQGEYPKVSIPFIRWHREPDLGGVFRGARR